MSSILDFDVCYILGEGGYGKVYKVTHKDSGQNLALKTCKMEGTDTSIQKYVLREVKVLSELKHENIVRYYESWIQPGHSLGYQGKLLYILMELCNGNSIRDAIKHKLCEDDTKIYRYMQGICKGLGYIHSRNIMHRDIKPNNILIMHDDIKIADFGMSRRDNTRHLSQSIGTPLYMAPELYGAGRYDYKVDIYSLGVTFFEMCTYYDQTDSISDVSRAYIPTHSPQKKKLICKMLTRDPRRRPDASEISDEIEHLYFSKGSDDDSTSLSLPLSSSSLLEELRIEHSYIYRGLSIIQNVWLKLKCTNNYVLRRYSGSRSNPCCTRNVSRRSIQSRPQY